MKETDFSSKLRIQMQHILCYNADLQKRNTGEAEQLSGQDYLPRFQTLLVCLKQT